MHMILPHHHNSNNNCNNHNGEWLRQLQINTYLRAYVHTLWYLYYCIAHGIDLCSPECGIFPQRELFNSAWTDTHCVECTLRFDFMFQNLEEIVLSLIIIWIIIVVVVVVRLYYYNTTPGHIMWCWQYFENSPADHARFFLTLQSLSSRRRHRLACCA